MRTYIPVRYERVCKQCGKEFIAHHIDKIYCSSHCRNTAYHIKQGHITNTNPDPYYRKCVVCGKEFETYIERKKCCSKECSRKYHNTKPRPGYKDKRSKHSWAEYVAIQKQKAIERQEVKRIEKEFYKKAHTVERECVICGSLFYCLDKEVNRTCSHECSREYARRKRNFRADNRINDSNLVDTDITLKKLYKRDNGICHLCGGYCDWDDYEITDGAFITKDNYPSIDHVVPLSLGGKHQWENVRLAHFKCNYQKGNITSDYTEEMSREHARMYASARCTNKKKTAQYSLDGKLIRIWDSTAQIKRELGLNDKHIQNVCRGYNSNTGNAYGYHWEYIVEHEDLKLKECGA